MGVGGWSWGDESMVNGDKRLSLEKRMSCSRDGCECASHPLKTVKTVSVMSYIFYHNYKV